LHSFLIHLQANLMHSQPIQFIRRDQRVSLSNVAPDRTLLDLLREDLGCTGTKEGCGEGDCGACTVVTGEPEGDGLRLRAVNSCIRLAHSVNGLALWTVEDLAQVDPPHPAQTDELHPAQKDKLHPAQRAMVACHGSQCGFCTPGFVMSLFAMYHNHVSQGRTITRALAQEELSGNLCRCTGYRPILDAAQTMGSLPRRTLDTANLLSKLKLLEQDRRAVVANLASNPAYLAPTTLVDLLQARAAHPKAQLVAGCTDVGLWVTKQHRQFGQVLDLTRTAELRRVEHYPQHLAIGAAVSLVDAFAALADGWPQLSTFANRFAGLSVRNSGTLGGNVANGSPIGDSMPLLIALGAHVVLMRWRDGQLQHRELPLQQLYTGYRTNVMAADELLAWIKVPRPVAGGQLRVYKISKRFDDDISAVCLAINLRLVDGVVQSASIGVGGVAATPVRAIKTEASLAGRTCGSATFEHANNVLQSEFSPISDMRASAAYRRQALGGLMQRFWLESQGMQQINLERFALNQELV
jgi:xanthine dehydrogenase small subunit